MSAIPQISELKPGTWRIDPAHSEIGFTVRHLINTVRGVFTDFRGDVLIADDPAVSRANAEIRMASIDTRNEERDAHVRSSEILDIENHPLMSFAGTGVSPARSGAHATEPRFYLNGILTIRGVSREARLLTEFHGTTYDPGWGTRAGFTASTTINRRDFGVQFNIPLQGDDVLLGDMVEIRLEIQAVLDG